MKSFIVVVILSLSMVACGGGDELAADSHSSPATPANTLTHSLPASLTPSLAAGQFPEGENFVEPPEMQERTQRSRLKPAARYPSALAIPANGFINPSPALPGRMSDMAWPSVKRSSGGWPSQSFSRKKWASAPVSPVVRDMAPPPIKRNSGTWPSEFTKRLKASSSALPSPVRDMAPLSAHGDARPRSILSHSADQLITHHSSPTSACRRLAEVSLLSPNSDFIPYINERLKNTHSADIPDYHPFNHGADGLVINHHDVEDGDNNFIFFDHYFFRTSNSNDKVVLGVRIKNLYKWNFIEKIFSEFNTIDFLKDEENQAKLVLVMTNFDAETSFDGVRPMVQKNHSNSDFPIVFRLFEDKKWYKFVLVGNQFSWKEIEVDHFAHWLGQGARFVYFTADECETVRAEEARSHLQQFNLGQIKEDAATSGHSDE